MNNQEIEEVHNEVTILESIDSNYVVKFHKSFNLNNKLYIVMEYCNGGDLSNLIISRKKTLYLPEETIWKYFIQICIGLSSLHNNKNMKILHRDIKSLNIFLLNDNIKIGDLGLAKKLNQNSYANTIVGTPYYLSPELCKYQNYNEKSDIWALGIVLYELAALKFPFDANNQISLVNKILRGSHPDKIPNLYSTELWNMITLLLKKDYLLRPSVNDILNNLSIYKTFNFY